MENTKELYGREVVEGEFTEVVEEVATEQEEQLSIQKEDEQVQPLRVRVVFHEGLPMEFVLNGLTSDDYKSFISNSIEFVSNGFFLGNAFIPRTNVEYFEQV